MKYKVDFRCTQCGADDTVEAEGDDLYKSVAARIENAHAVLHPECPAQQATGHIVVRLVA